MASPKHPILHAYVSLGSNLGDRAGNLLLGVRGMMEAGLEVIRLSSVYETEPVGTPSVVISSEPPVSTSSHPPFLNMVAELRGNSLPAPEQMLARMLRVEYALGRTRETHMAPRTIDLDLLLYKNETRATQFLSLPHPRLHVRRFVLVPLAELVPRLVHPTLNTSIADLLKRLEDQSQVVRWRPNASQVTM